MTKQLFDEENPEFENEGGESLDTNEIFGYDIHEEESGGFEFFGKFAIDDSWMSGKDENKNAHETFELKQLEEDLLQIFENSDLPKTYKDNKKVPKNEMFNIYSFFTDRIKDVERYTEVEKFLAITGFMKMNIEVMYRELPIVLKEAIVKEFNRKYHILSNKKSRKLF